MSGYGNRKSGLPFVYQGAGHESMDEPKWNPDKTADIRGKGTVNTYAVIMAGGGGSRFWPLCLGNAAKELLRRICL